MNYHKSGYNINIERKKGGVSGEKTVAKKAKMDRTHGGE